MSAKIIDLPTEPVLFRRYQEAFQAYELCGYKRDDELRMIEARGKWERLYLRLYAA